MGTSKNKKAYVLFDRTGGTWAFIGAWSNLKKLCEEVSGENEKFPSYWTWARMDKATGPLEAEGKDARSYVIYAATVK